MGIQARQEAKLMALPGVNGMGIGVDKSRRQLCFLVVVDKDAPIPAIPSMIEGVRGMVERHEPDVPLNGGSGCVPCHADQQAVPVPMGNSAFTETFCSACTLGFKACDLGGQKLVYVTNAHCTTNSSGCEGSATIGTDTRHVAPFDAGCQLKTKIGDVGGHAKPNCGASDTVDASKVDSADTLTSRTIRDIGTPSTSPGTVLPGDAVQKSGRTTGLTFGTVASVNFTGLVGPYCCGIATFVGQIRVNVAAPSDVFIMGGDSGSALLNTSNPPQIVGLLFSGPSSGLAGTANKIQEVLSALNLSLDPADCGGGGGGNCPARTAVEGTANETDTLATLHRFRDEVLARTPRGQQYTRQFYQFSGEMVRILITHPELLGQTRQALERYTPVIEAIVDQGGATVTQTDLTNIDRLLTTYATMAGPALRQTLGQLRRNIRDPQVQTEFGVRVMR
jgi:hypothetical protein